MPKRMGRPKSQRAKPPSDISVHEFFMEWLPQSIGADARRRKDLRETRAVIEFCLVDAEDDVYLVHIDEGMVRVEPGRSARADLRVEVDESTWRSLNHGKISAPEAVLRRRLRIRGDLALALKLHQILG